MSWPRLGVSAAAVAAVLAWAAPASAHARLVSSSPPGGATVTEAPARIVMDFSERIESSFGGVQVFGPTGQRVEAGAAEISGRHLELPLPVIDQAGTYTVAFRIISADGHPIEASFSFVFQPPPPATTVPPAATTTTAPPAARPERGPLRFELQDAGRGTEAGMWVSRLTNYLAFTAVMGLLVSWAFLLGPASPAAGLARRAVVYVGVLWAASCLSLFAFGLSTAAARPLPEVLGAELIGRFADTRFGRVVLAQAVLAAVVVALVLIGQGRKISRAALGVAALAAVAPALWGHAGTDDLPALAVASDWGHVLAVTTWVGGLAALAFLLLRRHPDHLAEPLRRFSRVAGWALAVVVATGVVNALVHLGGPEQLTDTGWGRLVLAKAALLGAVALLGRANRQRVVARLGALTPGSQLRRAFARIAAAELALMALALGVATQMASTIPADAEAASRIQSLSTAFGPGQLNVTVDPARPGANTVHVYFLDEAGRVDDRPAEPRLMFTRAGAELVAELVRAGPGHYTALGQRLEESGEWILRVQAVVEGQPVAATGAIALR